jgi:tetraacyldisaccharide 4'-kinase
LKRKAIYLLYRVLQGLVSPVILIYLLLRGLRSRPYFTTVRERCGQLPASFQQTISASIWLHAVSVGEVLAAIPLIEELKRRTPETAVFVSTTTLAGRETADKRLAGLADGIFFAPFDFVWAVRRVLRQLRPAAAIVLETEIWPNLFREVKRTGAGLILVNGRISDRALPRYRRFRLFFSDVLGLCDRILTQSEEMQRRFIAAGASAASVEAGGNLKYDFAPGTAAADSPAVRFIEADRSRPLWIAASTSADDYLAEEDFVVAAQRGLPGWRLIVAPRKPERFEEVAGRLARSGLRWTRRSALEDPDADVLLLDSVGELSGLFPYAKAVFMGGTLADRGGHNILEPAIFGKAVVAGPHLENFREIADHFERRQAIRRIASGEELRDAIAAAGANTALGERALAAAREKRGAAAVAADRTMAVYDSVYPRQRNAQPAQAILWFLSLLWRAGSAIDRRRKRAHVRKLPVPVISVGNITVGGTGKTPVTIELLRSFQKLEPGLLTRGYGRDTRQNVMVCNEDHRMPVSITGDEAHLCRRETGVPIGVGANRYEAGKELLADSHVQLLVLDDGFQHLQLHRDFDLVLIDASNPFGGGYALPLGRLREPLESLQRADALLITRADEAPNTKGIESVLRRYNATAPVFRARTVVRGWAGAGGATIDARDLRNARTVAFCGLANPASFRRTLRREGIAPLDWHEYEDHHRYTPSEIRRLARHAADIGADVLLTTAKDAVNLDADYPAIVGPVKLFWLEIDIAIDRRDELLALIESRLQRPGAL